MPIMAIPTPSRFMKRLGALAVAGACLLPASTASAQSQPGIELERFYTSWAGDRFFAVPNPWALGDPGIHAKLVADYALNPLELSEDDAAGAEQNVFLVRHQLHARLNGTFALWHRVAINLDIPVALVNSGDNGTLPNSGALLGASGIAVGDFRLGIRGRVYGEDDDVFQFGVGGNLWLPVGPDGAGDYTGAGAVRGRILLNAGGILDRFIWAFDLGPELGPEERFAGIAQGSMLRYGLAGGYLLGDDMNFQLGLEAYGTMVFEDPNAENTNFEILAGAKYKFSENLALGAAAGPGIPRSIGTPNFRGVVSLEFSIQPGTGDGDKDGDGIPDGDDACPTEKGRASSNPLKHGCPRREDRDFDLIWDDEDACPDVPGVESSDPEKNGCPLSDRDGDGITDAKDACPDTPGIASLDFRKHGCPAPDSDKDGIPDAEDACPKKAGKPNKDPNKHGCPDNAKVIISGGEIKILERIEFDTSKATIRSRSNDIVDQVAEVMKDNPDIKKIEVQGHTDNRGPAFYNRNLSKQRAEAVVAALVKRGIKRSRMTAKGFGPDKPVADNGTDEGRQQNRRVQFVIKDRDE